VRRDVFFASIFLVYVEPKLFFSLSGGKILQCSLNSILYYVFMQFILYGGPPMPTAMNAVLAIIADGGRSIVAIYREAVEIN
jgi:hypothetical protein